MSGVLTDKGLAVAGGMFSPRDPLSYNNLPMTPWAGFWREPGYLCFGQDPDKPGEAFLRRKWPDDRDPAQ